MPQRGNPTAHGRTIRLTGVVQHRSSDSFLSDFLGKRDGDTVGVHTRETAPVFPAVMALSTRIS